MQLLQPTDAGCVLLMCSQMTSWLSWVGTDGIGAIEVGSAPCMGTAWTLADHVPVATEFI